MGSCFNNRASTGFKHIATINGAGTSNGTQSYDYLDKTNPSGTSYYRLKQVDVDGKFSYSNPIAVRSGLGNEISVYPNPFSNEINVSANSDFNPSTNVHLYDTFGRNQSIKFKVHGNKLDVKTSGLPIGTYVLRIVTGKTVYNKVVVKN